MAPLGGEAWASFGVCSMPSSRERVTPNVNPH
jgi:hypothetical protein